MKNKRKKRPWSAAGRGGRFVHDSGRRSHRDRERMERLLKGGFKLEKIEEKVKRRKNLRGGSIHGGAVDIRSLPSSIGELTWVGKKGMDHRTKKKVFGEDGMGNLCTFLQKEGESPERVIAPGWSRMV